MTEKTIWFTNWDGCIGIVLHENDTTKERTIYIGPAKGFDEKYDEKRILECGQKISLEVAEMMADFLKNKRMVW